MSVKVAPETKYHPERDVLLDDVFTESFKRSGRKPFSSTRAIEQALGFEFALLNYIDGFRKWTKGRGSNYFDVAPIANLFANTDVDDVHVSDVDLPYECFYLHFGKLPALQVKGTEQFIEGVYIGELPGTEESGPGIAAIFVCNFPDWGSAADLSFETIASTHVLCGRTVLLRERSVGQSLSFTEGLDGDPRIYEDKDMCATAMRLLVNSLLYISSPKAEVDVEYGSDAPEGWVKKALKGDANATKVLDHRPCTKIRVCGRKLMQSLAGTSETGKSVEPHWRKGHWRRVVVGEGRAQRRWHWFLPTVVNSKLGLPKDGSRVYDHTNAPIDTIKLPHP
jgi:hypothetical protein